MGSGDPYKPVVTSLPYLYSTVAPYGKKKGIGSLKKKAEMAIGSISTCFRFPIPFPEVN